MKFNQIEYSARCVFRLTVFLIGVNTVLAQDVPNPFQKAAVGDWVRYYVTSESSVYPMKYTVTRRITAIDSKKVSITQDVIYHEAKGDEARTLDQSRVNGKTLPLHQLLDYEQPPPGRIETRDQQTEAIKAAGRDFSAIRTHYVLGRGTSDVAEKRIWIHPEVPLEGIVKSQTIIKGFAGSINTETLIAFGKAGDPLPPIGSDGKEPKQASRPTQTNSLKMELVKLKGEAFVMGAMPLLDFNRKALMTKSPEEKLELLSLTPPHRNAVIDRDYWIATREVTVAQFRKFVDATGYPTEAEQDARGGTGRLENGRFGQASHFTWQELGFPLDDEYPVVNVSWNDAREFCEWLSEKEQAVYRLPTEAEWEYACRGGIATRFFCGDKQSDLKGFANVADEALEAVTPGLPWTAPFNDGVDYLAKVGSYKANPYGLYDMHGNALEWCGTKFGFFDPLEDVGAPHPREKLYCLRGGNWFNEADRGGCASRSGAPATMRMSLIGFRVVKEDEAPASR